MLKPSLISVVVGIIINSKQEVLIAQRPQQVPQSGLWEFPGGKIESNELAYEALCRELDEEIGIKVLGAKLITEYSHAYPHCSVTLSVWSMIELLGKPFGKEGQRVRWISMKDRSE